MKIVYESTYSQLITCDQKEYNSGKLDQLLAEQLIRGYIWYKIESSIETKQMYIRTEFKIRNQELVRKLFLDTSFA